LILEEHEEKKKVEEDKYKIKKRILTRVGTKQLLTDK
jgi:hypothetical protein